MRVLPLCSLFGLLLALSSPSLFGGDNTTPAPKAKGYLPANWKQLGLSDEQRQKVYQTQAEFRAKIEVLEAQIKELKAKERSELEKVLTDAQKARLREILASKAPGGTPEKKPEPKEDK